MSFYSEDEFLKNAIKKVAAKWGVTYFQAYDVYHARLACMKSHIETLDYKKQVFPTVKVPYLGTFSLSVTTKKRLISKLNRQQHGSSKRQEESI